MVKIKNKNTFEESIRHLEGLVSKMETGEGTLENNMKWFDEGIQLVKSCRKELEISEKKVQELMGDSEGEYIIREKV